MKEISSLQVGVGSNRLTVVNKMAVVWFVAGMVFYPQSYLTNREKFGPIIVST